MNTSRLTIKRLLGAGLPLLLLGAIACSQAPAANPQTIEQTEPIIAAPTAAIAPDETNIQASFDSSTMAEEPTPASISPEASTGNTAQRETAPSQVSVIDADAIVAAFEEVLGRVHHETLPSVVQIQVAQRVSESDNPNFNFPFPFGQSPDNEQEDPQDFFFRNGEGSGFIWDIEGHIVTNQHVIDNADRVIVTFSDGTEADAEVIGEDPDSDLAVIKVDLPEDRLMPVQLGDSNDVRVGHLAIAIGNPFGQEFTTTSGIVSAIGRTIRSGNTPFSVPKVIQTDAPINPGNSGGPLLNRQGEVIGINTQIVSRSGANSGIGFAVPVNTAKQVIPNLIEGGDFNYAWLGISGSTLRPEVAELMDIPDDVRGAQIIQLAENGPAEEAGLRESDSNRQTDDGLIPVGGDVIVAIDDSPITTMDDLIIYLIENTRPGDMITLDVVRDGGETAQIEVTLGERPN